MDIPMTDHSSPANAAPPSGLSERIGLYLEDAPSSGGHSDAAGANCWELLQEAMEELRIRAQPAASPENAEAKCSYCNGTGKIELTVAERNALSDLEMRDVLIRAQQMTTRAEIQSGMDRQKWAENLILQLPPDHNGRNSWLLNYGRTDFAHDLRKQRGLTFDERSQAINPPAFTSPEHQSAPVYAATHNSGEGDPSVMPDYAGADTFDIETEQREGWTYD